MFSDIIKVIRLLAPIIMNVYKEIKHSRKQANSIEQQNSKLRVRLEKERSVADGRKITKLIKETRKDG